jgi:hypothetical protein
MLLKTGLRTRKELRRVAEKPRGIADIDVMGFDSTLVLGFFLLSKAQPKNALVNPRPNLEMNANI